MGEEYVTPAERMRAAPDMEKAVMLADLAKEANARYVDDLLLEAVLLRCRVEDLRQALLDLLARADAMWEEKRQGHDWAEACVRARVVLGREKAWRA